MNEYSLAKVQFSKFWTSITLPMPYCYLSTDRVPWSIMFFIVTNSDLSYGSRSAEFANPPERSF